MGRGNDVSRAQIAPVLRQNGYTDRTMEPTRRRRGGQIVRLRDLGFVAHGAARWEHGADSTRSLAWLR